MKIAVLSDTHGNHGLAADMLSRISAVDHIIHLGDNVADADCIEYELARPIIKIAGNCDYACGCPREILLEIDETRIFATHGDHYSVKSGLDNLLLKSTRERAEIALYGHTHVPFIRRHGNTLLVNPGSLKKDAATHSLAIISINKNNLLAELVFSDILDDSRLP